MYKKQIFVGLVVGLLCFAGCGSEDGSRGRLNLYITDAPIDDAEIKSAFIAINSVELKGENGWKTIKSFDRPLAIDLLRLQHGQSMLILEQYVDAGKYSALRLNLNAQEPESGLIKSPGCNMVKESGVQQTLFATSENQNKSIDFPFVMPDNGIASYTLDFDLRKSILPSTTKELFLNPSIRIVDNATAATIAGSFSMEESPVGVVIYAYKQGGYNATENSRSENQPAFNQATSSVKLKQDGTFVLGFLPPASYDLVFTRKDSDGELASVMGTYKNVSLSPKEVEQLNIRLSDLEN